MEQTQAAHEYRRDEQRVHLIISSSHHLIISSSHHLIT